MVTNASINGKTIGLGHKNRLHLMQLEKKKSGGGKWEEGERGSGWGTAEGNEYFGKMATGESAGEQSEALPRSLRRERKLGNRGGRGGVRDAERPKKVGGRAPYHVRWGRCPRLDRGKKFLGPDAEGRQDRENGSGGGVVRW